MTLPDLTTAITENGYPPVMAWQSFADWVRIDHGVVRGWIELGHIPTVKIGKRVLVNVIALVEGLQEGTL